MRVMIGIIILKIFFIVKKEDKNIEDFLEFIGSVFFFVDLKQEYFVCFVLVLMKKIGRILSIIIVVVLNVVFIVDGIYFIKEN